MNKLLTVTAFLSISILALSMVVWAKNKSVSDQPNLSPADTKELSNVIELNADNAQTLISSIPTILIVDFYAEWCGPCKTLKPIFETVAGELKNKYAFAKINVDTCQEVAKNYGISSLPTIAIMSGGKIIEKIVGLQTKEALIKKINEAVAGPRDLSKLDKPALNDKLLRALQSFASLDEIKRILEAGADVNCVGSNGFTPLMLTVMVSSSQGMDTLEVVKLLLEYGASTEFVTADGQKTDALAFTQMMENRLKTIAQNFEKLSELFQKEAKKKSGN